MTFDYPIWLTLAIPLAASIWLWRMPSRLLTVMRAVLLALLVLAMAGPRIKIGNMPGTLIVLADRSLSMPAGSDLAMKQAIELIAARQPADARLAVVSFGRDAHMEQPAMRGEFDGFRSVIDQDGSNLSEAIETAASMVSPSAPARLLVLSDGRWSGSDPAGAASKAASRRISIDYRALSRPAAGDIAIARLETPGQVNPGESFLIHAWIYSPANQEVEVCLRRGQSVLSSGPRALTAGMNYIAFRDQAQSPSVLSYSIEIRSATNDPVPENNLAKALVGVVGKKPLLYVTKAEDSALARLLASSGLDIRIFSPDVADFSLDALGGCSAVLIEDTAASDIGHAAMKNLTAWVRDAGGGLMMTGGREAYGTGGYFQSPLEEVMPVSMELRKEHRKFSLAMVVTMDRSGSMAMAAGGKTKMDLANMAAAQVLEMLTPMDEFAVVAVDSSPHVVVPLAAPRDKASMRSKILSIESMGGGIFIYEALSNAAALLSEAQAGTRHIILLADAADSEEPGDYKNLLDKCAKAGVTVSVVGLGNKSDQDAALLEDIAKRGRGQCYFTEDAHRLPQLFAQDTFLVARSAFVEEPTGVKITPTLAAMTGRQFSQPPPLGGYNLCYLRPHADMSAFSQDQYKAPIVANWQAGLGRVLCYTGQADGKFAGPIAKWREVSDFYSSLARWTAGRANQPRDDVVLTQSIVNGSLSIRLNLGKDAQMQLTGSRPDVTLLRGGLQSDPRTLKQKMEYLSVETLGLDVPMNASETVLATIQMPGCEPVTLPPVCLPYSFEFAPNEDGKGEAALENICRLTGGFRRADVAEIWRDVPSAERLANLAPWLFLAAVLLLLAEVFQRRTGMLGHLAVGARLAPAAARVGRLARRLVPMRLMPRRTKRRPAAGTSFEDDLQAQPMPPGGSHADAAASKPQNAGGMAAVVNGHVDAPVTKRQEAASQSAPSGQSVLDAIAEASRRARQRTDKD